MEKNKIFLGKYRVSASEIALSNAGPVANDPAPETHDGPVVYRAEEIGSGQDVLVEVIPAASLSEVVRGRLEAEAAAAKKLNHINIPALFDFGVEDDQLIYVTEVCDGTSAEEWVNAHGPMPTGAVLRIASQVVSAMGAAAMQKISHHAINPTNLLLVPGQTPEGDWPLVKVLHFVGVAPKFSSETDISVASFDKSSHYASPEQLQHGKVDFRSELYSLGATMWFLLTGAPPLMAPNGPLAMQPTTNGLAVDKLSGMPKRVRRLLAQMLAANPNGRPQDPLAFYRQIKDCLAQIGRRETLARRFGVPLFSRSKTVAVRAPRRFPTKALALAAVLLAIATLAAFIVPGYLRHERIRQAEEPIGVPIGVPDAAAPSAPAVAATNPAPPNPSVVNSNQVQNPPVNSADQNNTAPAPSDSAAVVAANNPAPAPVETAPPANPQIEEQPRVVANDATPPPSTARIEKDTSRELTASVKPAETPDTPASEPQSHRTTDVTAIPTARPVSPEVRRAEPAPPGEGPENIAPDATSDSETKAETRLPAKTERLAKAKRESKKDLERRVPVAVNAEDAERSLPPLPRGQTRARFIGVTPDGQWMLSLPSKKIVVIPAPPGG
ncbi:MAG: eukaryotic-like serine/threonine-protein kinase [Verrucomicrobiota bacterium]|jgi:serine/threonine-protein kinase